LGKRRRKEGVDDVGGSGDRMAQAEECGGELPVRPCRKKTDANSKWKGRKIGCKTQICETKKNFFSAVVSGTNDKSG